MKICLCNFLRKPKYLYLNKKDMRASHFVLEHPHILFASVYFKFALKNSAIFSKR